MALSDPFTLHRRQISLLKRQARQFLMQGRVSQWWGLQDGRYPQDLYGKEDGIVKHLHDMKKIRSSNSFYNELS